MKIKISILKWVILFLVFAKQTNAQLAVNNPRGTATAADGQTILAGVNTQINQYNVVTSASGTSVSPILPTAFRSKRVLVIQMQGASSGTSEWATVNASGNGFTAPLLNTYSTSGGSVAQVVLVPQYYDLLIPAGVSITCPAFDPTTGGGVIAFNVKNIFTNNGLVDASCKGCNGAAGSIGTAGGAGAIGGAGGAANNQGISATGSGVAMQGFANGGSGTLYGNASASGSLVSQINSDCPGCLTTGAVNITNTSGNPKQPIIGGGGNGGYAGTGAKGAGAGGGGGGSATAAGQNGINGGTGGNGGNGGKGGRGGGIIIFSANDIQVASGTRFDISGCAGTIGSNGTNGGNGGKGGTGAGDCGFGGGGGGGRGADGGQAGAGGNGGAGGILYFLAPNSVPSFSAKIKKNGGLAGQSGNSGAGGIGATAGANAAGANCGGSAGSGSGTSGCHILPVGNCDMKCCLDKLKSISQISATPGIYTAPILGTACYRKYTNGTTTVYAEEVALNKVLVVTDGCYCYITGTQNTMLAIHQIWVNQTPTYIQGTSQPCGSMQGVLTYNGATYESLCGEACDGISPPPATCPAGVNCNGEDGQELRDPFGCAPITLVSTCVSNGMPPNSHNEISITGGDGPFTADKGSVAGNSITVNDVAINPGQQSTINITDANGCAGSLTFTLCNVIINPPFCNLSNIVTNALCFGGEGKIVFTSKYLLDMGQTAPCSKTISITGVNGTTSITTVMNPASGNTRSTAELNLPAGLYSWNTVDPPGMPPTGGVNGMFTITQPTQIIATTTSTNENCTDKNGTATVSANGGTGGLYYTWAPSGGNAATANNLAKGTYTVTVSDMNGCTVTSTVTVNRTACPQSTCPSCSLFVTVRKPNNGGSLTLSQINDTLFCSKSYTFTAATLTCNPINNSIFILSAKITNSAGVTPAWANNFLGTGNINIPANTIGTFYVKYIWGTATTICDSVTYPIFISCKPPCNLTANAGMDTTICNGTATTIGSPAVSGNSYSWVSIPSGFTSNNSNPTVSPSIFTRYFLTVTNLTSQCIAKDTVIVSVDNCPPPCTTCSLQAVITKPNGGNVTLNTSIITQLECSTTYNFLQGILSCAAANNSILVKQIQFMNSSGITPAWATSFNGFGMLTIPPNTTGTYYLKYTWGTSVEDCDTASYIFNINCPCNITADAGIDKTICKAASTKIGTPAISRNTYSWTSNPGNFTSSQAQPTVSVTTTTTFYLTVTNTATQCIARDTVIVTVANCDPPKCTPCQSITCTSNTIGLTSQPNLLGSELTQSFTFAGLPLSITEVKATVTNIKLFAVDENGVAKEECIACNFDPRTWASIINGSSIAGVVPKININGIQNNAPITLLPTANARNIVWNNSSVISVNNPLQLTFLLPEKSSLPCCKRKATICVKFVFRNDVCEECTVNKCFDVEIK
jgi:hypothetical protein